jgi:hypothetical protein
MVEEKISGERPKNKNISFNSTLNEPYKSNDDVINDEKILMLEKCRHIQ